MLASRRLPLGRRLSAQGLALRLSIGALRRVLGCCAQRLPLGNGTEFTIGELAELVISLTNSRSQLIRLPLPADDPRQRRPDTTVAETKLGWKATTPLSEGLKHTIAYFDQLLAERGDTAAPGKVRALAAGAHPHRSQSG